MKRSFVALAGIVILLGTINSVSAQSSWATSEGSVFRKGDAILSPGVMTWPFGAFMSYDYAVHDAISVGGAAGYRFWFISDWMYHGIPFVARAAFHPFNLAAIAEHIGVRDKIDVYIGPALGLAIAFDVYTGQYDQFYENDTYVDPIVREYIGIRYYVNDRMAWFAEEGAGLGWINIGISLKM